ncbi:MAG TPA: hypothetical protein DHV62_06835 [Elusimicrobia bacterium]|nr:hypothetical protein [Elusimicrobiota bacterium]
MCSISFYKSEGKIVVVDISPGMLEKAKSRVKKNGWNNFEFIAD